MTGYGTRLWRHRPVRPGWMCCWCRLPYPCPEGRAALVRRYGYGGDLAVLVVELMEDAIADGVASDAAVLFGRFIAWTRPQQLAS